MKKKVLLSMALLSAVVTIGGTPLTSYAAGTKTVQSKRVTVYRGHGIESLCQTLKLLGITIKDSCPDVEIPDEDTTTPEIPGTEVPEKPNPPIADTSGTETPDTEIPDTSVTEKPNPPAAETPDTQEPEETPDTGILSYAEQVVKLVNEERAKAGLPALEVKDDVAAAANVRAREIKQVFSHTRPDGSNFSSALKEQNVSYRGAGENIAWGQKTPEQVMNGWMNSSGHRANILNKNYKNIGVGYYQDERGTNYWVQLFTY